MYRVWRSLLVASVVACGLTSEVALERAAACPMCKAALEEDDVQPMAYQTSILFMLSMPMGIFGTIALVLTVLNRKELAALNGTEMTAEASA